MATREERRVGLVGLAAAVVEGMRPADWLKNGFTFAPLIFSQSLHQGSRDLRVAATFGILCLISSAAYLFNDVMDCEEDRRHPVKCHRPVAAGRLPVRMALMVASILAAAGLLAAWLLDFGLLLVVGTYALLNVLYSWFLKHLILVDVFGVAAGFVLRVIAGAVVIHVDISPWLIVCTSLLALFLALSKRRHELVLLEERAGHHRSVLARYSPYLLDQLIAVVTASTLISYALYTLSEDVSRKFPGKRLELTIPFVIFGIFRYLYLLHRGESVGSPTKLLLTDRFLVGVVLLWVASVVFLIYL